MSKYNTLDMQASYLIMTLGSPQLRSVLPHSKAERPGTGPGGRITGRWGRKGLKAKPAMVRVRFPRTCSLTYRDGDLAVMSGPEALKAYLEAVEAFRADNPGDPCPLVLVDVNRPAEAVLRCDGPSGKVLGLPHPIRTMERCGHPLAPKRHPKWSHAREWPRVCRKVKPCKRHSKNRT